MRHELHLARFGFAALAAVAAASAGIGAIVGGRAGVASALIGVGLVAANHGVAVLSTGWSRTVSPTVIAVGFSVFVVRMLFVLGLFGSLQAVGWINDGLLAVSFCVALIASLVAECLSYVRGSYVPAWMRRQALPLKELTR